MSAATGDIGVVLDDSATPEEVAPAPASLEQCWRTPIQPLANGVHARTPGHLENGTTNRCVLSISLSLSFSFFISLHSLSLFMQTSLPLPVARKFWSLMTKEGHFGAPTTTRKSHHKNHNCHNRDGWLYWSSHRHQSKRRQSMCVTFACLFVSLLVVTIDGFSQIRKCSSEEKAQLKHLSQQLEYAFLFRLLSLCPPPTPPTKPHNRCFIFRRERRQTLAELKSR
jgi:hypothetical protein